MELVRKLEFGLDLSFLNDRIQLNVDYYRNRTVNQLVGQPLPSVAGFTRIQANLPAILQNKGYEFQINTANVKGRNFSWSSSINFTIPTNKLLAFENLANNPSYANLYQIGSSVYIQKLLHYTGVDPQTGIYTFEDVNHDGTINSKDNQFTKAVAQTFYGGFQNNFTFKGWELDFLFQFVKQTGINYLAYSNNIYQATPAGYSGVNQPTAILNAWQKPGDRSSYQQFTAIYGTNAYNAFSNYIQSDASITDASFIRLKNVSLAYQIPLKWQHGLHLRSARVYLQAQNLLTITNYLGLDPETQSASLPPLRMITAGIQMGL